MATSATIRGRSVMSGWSGLGVAAVIILVGALATDGIARIIGAPWSLGLGAQATLTGTWTGVMRARQGAEYGLLLDLEYRSTVGHTGTGRRRGRTSSSNLEGRASICTRRGERYEYDVRGHADRAGVIRRLWLEYDDPQRGTLDLSFTGQWDGQTLALAADRNPFLPDGSFMWPRTTSSSDPDDGFDFITLNERSRAGFEAACRRIQP